MKRAIVTLFVIGALGATLAPMVSASLTEQRYYIQAKHSGKCVHQHGRIRNIGGLVTQWECINQPNVQLTRGWADNGYFVLRFKHSDLCLTVKNGLSANGTDIIQSTCTGSSSQKWREVRVDGSYVKIQSAIGSCLHQHGGILDNGGRITLWECIDQPNVMWKIIRAN
jgi:hypothetical protein